jgi:Tfp pilus assembly protein PilN
MRAVNLLPREDTSAKGRQVSPPLVTGMVVAVIVLAVLGAGFVRGSAKVSHKRTELAAARAELSLIPAPVAPDTASTTLATERMQRITALQGALNGRVSWDRVLREISLVLPNDVWLTGLTLEAPAAAPVPTAGTTTQTPPPPVTAATIAAPTGFTMTGKAFTHVGVARLLKRLALIPDLENVTLGHSTQAEVGKRQAVEFSVTAGVRIPGATQ